MKEKKRNPFKLQEFRGINPEIVKGEGKTTFDEGCLSIPEQYADVQRPASCRVRWQDETGAAHEEELTGLLATCMQHEIDQLDGIFWLQRLSRLKRDRLIRRWEKAQR